MNTLGEFLNIWHECPHEAKDELSHWPLLNDKVIVTSHIAHSYVNTDKMCHIHLWKGSFRAVQRIFFLLCPQCNLRVSPIIVGTVSFVFLQQTIHSHMKFDGQSQNTSTWVTICSETYCIFKILCFLVLVGCFEGFFLNQWKNSAIFQGLSGLLVLPYFYECNRWLHHFLPHTDCSREHLTVQHLKWTPRPGEAWIVQLILSFSKQWTVYRNGANS